MVIDPRPRSRARDCVAAGSVLALAVLAGAAFSRIYDGPTLLALLAGAAGGSVLLAAALRAARLPLPIAVLVNLVTLIGYLFVATALTQGASERGSGVVELFLDAMQNSGARILTSTIPILATPDTVFLPIVVIWVAGAAGAELALRAGSMIGALAPPTIAYGVGLVLVGPNVEPSVAFALLYVSAAAFALAVTGAANVSGTLKQVARSARRRYRARRLVLVSLGLVVLIAVSLQLGPWVADWSDQRPADPRSHVAAPQQELPETNPLARLSSWAVNADEKLFTVTTSSPERISWVALSDFDGLTWKPGTTYRSAGSVLPVEEPARNATNVTQEYRIDGLDGVWLPAVNQASQVRGVRVSYDEESGTLLRPEGLTDKPSYTVKSERPNLDNAALRSANGAAETRFDKYREHPGTPATISQLATEITAAGGTGYQQALLIERYLKQNYHFVADAPSGHGYPNLNFFLNTPFEAGGHRGTSEQFATAFALLARIVGLPSRVVVGFHAGTPIGNNTYQVRSGDAYAWPEIYLENHGWVAFNPTPQPSNQPPPPEESTAEAKERDQHKAEELDRLDDPQPTPNDDKKAAAAADSRDRTPILVFVLVVPLAVLLTVAAGILLGRSRIRAKRLRAPDPVKRIVGSWHHVREGLALAGRGAGADDAVTAVVARAREPVRGRELPELGELARAVNAAAFAATLPSDVGSSAAAADGAVRSATDYVRALRRAQPWWRRLWWNLDPRPFTWSRR